MNSKTEKQGHHKPRPVGRPQVRKECGRPQKAFPEQEIVQLAAEGSTDGYIASRLGISKTLLTGKYKDLLDSGREQRNGDIQRRQFQLAMSGNVPMLMWLGKNWLNQGNKVERNGNDGLKELIAELNKRSEQLGPPEGMEEETPLFVERNTAPD